MYNKMSRFLPLVFLLSPAYAFKPEDRGELVDAIIACNDDFTNCPNGPIGDWDTSLVESMFTLFNNKGNFNEDISAWDTSSVTNMEAMFRSAESFNQDISGWDTGKVTTMKLMFNNATAFDQDISCWDMTSVNNTEDMFLSATTFDDCKKPGPYDAACGDPCPCTGIDTPYEQCTVRDPCSGDDPADFCGINGIKDKSCGVIANAPVHGESIPKYFELDGVVYTTVGANNTQSWFTCATEGYTELTYQECSEFKDKIALLNPDYDQEFIPHEFQLTLTQNGCLTENFFDRGKFWFNSNPATEIGCSGTSTCICKVDTPTCPTDIWGWDTYGDGWNGNEFTAYRKDGTSQILTFSAGNFGFFGEFENLLSVHYTKAADWWGEVSIAIDEVWYEIPYWDAETPIKNSVIWYDCDASRLDFSYIPDANNPPRCIFKPADKTELVVAVDDCLSRYDTWFDGNAEWGTDGYWGPSGIGTGCNIGEMNQWDTSLITDMSGLFKSKVNFNADIRSWDTSSVTTMDEMFDNAQNFNQDISSWDTGKVTSMNSMLYDTKVSTVSIGCWDVTNVTNNTYFISSTQNQCLSPFQSSHDRATNGCNMCSHFKPTIRDELKDAVDFCAWAYKRNSNCGNFGEMNTWDTSDITDMSMLFESQIDFNADISSWDTSKVTTMSKMFMNANNFNGDISSWDTRKVTDMSTMFHKAYEFTTDISNWNTSSVTTMKKMFQQATKFNADISPWNTSSVTDMGMMFYKSDSFNQDISSWDTRKVTNMEYLFFGADVFDQNLACWNTNSLIDYINWFNYEFDECKTPGKKDNCPPCVCTAVDAPYDGCTDAICTDVDTPYAGCAAAGDLSCTRLKEEFIAKCGCSDGNRDALCDTLEVAYRDKCECT